MVDVAEEEVMYWPIPVPRELVPGDGIPPVCVEAPVREIGDFGQKVEDAFPDHVPRLSSSQRGTLKGGWKG